MQAILGAVLSTDSNFVDVGANQGSKLALAHAYAPSGQHFAFEPLPELAASLVKRFPTVTVHAAALADSDGATTFNRVVDRPALSGLSVGKAKGLRIEHIEVPLRRLDDVLPDSYRVDVVKIDVEGAEYGVLRGGLSVLARCRPLILFEHSVNLAPNFETTPDMVFELFSDIGYRVFDMDGCIQSRDEFVENFSSHARFNWFAR